MLFVTGVYARTIYISPDGDDASPGTKARPFQTLERARDTARTIKTTVSGTGEAAIICLRGGVYVLKKTFELNGRDSGSTYRAYPGEFVKIIGGREIPLSAIEPVSDPPTLKRVISQMARSKVRQIDLRALGIADYGRPGPRGFRRPYAPAPLELFIDDQPLTIAQWPNRGEPRVPIGKVLDQGSIPRNGDFSGRGGRFHYDVDRPELWKQAQDVWISGHFQHGYADDTVKVKSIDFKNNILETVQPHMYGFGSGKPWNTWFALNLLEEIDQPGEYYVDTRQGVLYFYPPDDYDPHNSVIQVSMLKEPMIALEGASHVSLEGLTLECARGMGVYIERGASCRVNGCTLRNLGIVAVCIGKGTEDLEHYAHEGTAAPASRRIGSWHEHLYKNSVFDREGGKDHGIVSCDIYNIGSGGVHLGGGNRATLVPAGNFVRNCRIHHANRLGRTYKACVNIDGVGNIVQHCLIHDAPGNAFYVHGNNHLFEYNEIHDVMLDGDDQGAWYIGRDPSEFGNVIRYNYFHHIGLGPNAHSTWGLYFDDMACGTHTHGNIFYRVGKKAAVLVGGGKYNTIENNVFIDCPLAICMDNRGHNWAKSILENGAMIEDRTLHQLDITKSPFADQYPELANYWNDHPGLPANPIRKNLAVRTRLTNAKSQWGPIENNWETKNDPGFANIATGNFSLEDHAPVFNKIDGFEPPPFTEMGLYVDTWRKDLLSRNDFVQAVPQDVVTSHAESKVPAGTEQEMSEGPAFDPYTMTWTTPAKGSQDSMPLGNGDIGLNAWVESNGDLLFYIAKTDAWSENGRLLKLGKVRVTLFPSPLAEDETFLQQLSLKKGEIAVCLGATRLRLWVDANHPAIEVDIDSPRPITARVSIEPWRVARRQLIGQELVSAYGLHGDGAQPTYVEPDTILQDQQNRIVWYHRNDRSIWSDNLHLQALGRLTQQQNDPLLHRTFGAMIEGDGLVTISDRELKSTIPRKKHHISIYPLTRQTKTPERWLELLTQKAEQIATLSHDERREKHHNAWEQFWARSYIHVRSKDSGQRETTNLITQGYALQRFINACAGCGNAPIKFNGSLFTTDTQFLGGSEANFDADYRRWGGPYWWQNTRLPYWSMLSAGDYDLMKPLFRMYRDALPLRKAATKEYYQHDGAFYPETMYFWGTYTDANYGRNRTGMPDGLTKNLYIRYYWQGGLEFSLMMLDYYEHTLDKAFAHQSLVPICSSVLTFYDEHWQRDKRGKIHFEPAMALETYREAVNPLPVILGIQKVAEGMLALPKSLTGSKQRVQWKRLIDELPDVPTREVHGHEVLAPAQTYRKKQNRENPELYAIFPYRQYGVGQPDMDLAKRTFAHREHKGTGGWQQNAIHAAYLGLADESAQMVATNLGNSNPNFRFPAMWGPNFDWTPDQDHGAVAMLALQRMLLQYDGNKIRLLPAWLEQWDVDFKLHAPKNTTITGQVRNGRFVELDVTPQSRGKDIEMRK